MGGRNVEDVYGTGISRARFLRLAGLGAGISLIPASLAFPEAGSAQVAGSPSVLDRYPIAAWWPPPPVPKTDPDPPGKTAALYAQLARAGFNTVIGGNGVGNNRANGLALDACGANDLWFVLADGALQNAINGTAPKSGSKEGPQGVLQALAEQDSPTDLRAQATADRQTISQRIQDLRLAFGDHSALAGVVLYDEPHRSLFGTLRYARKEVERLFGEGGLPYVNVWPSYASPKTALGTRTYAEYLERFMDEARYPSAVAPPVLSFDHYPLLLNERTTADFFYNHAVVRAFSRRFGVPSWAFVQSMAFDGRKVGLEWRRAPDEAEVFWQVNVALAYGVKGIQYFTYWTPQNNQVRFGNAMITRSGSRTPLYYYAQRANAYLTKVGAVLLPLNSISVTHANEPKPPRGARPFRGNPHVRAASGSPVILGFFTKPGAPDERYLLVTNRSPNKAAKARLTISGTVRSVERFDPAKGNEGAFVPVKLGGTPPRYLYLLMSPGRARLYRLRIA